MSAESKVQAGSQDYVGLLCAFLLVATFSAVTSRAPPATEQAVLPWTLDPAGLHTVKSYFLIFLLFAPAKSLLDTIVDFFVVWLSNPARIDQCKSGSVKRLERLELQDKCFLAFDTIVEYVGMNHVVAFALGGSVHWPMDSLSAMNGPVAYLVVLLVNDIVYWPFHWVAHFRAVYPCWHKQHHRQSVPFRGVNDAANLNPNESTYGFAIFIASLAAAARSTGLHGAAVWCALITWAALNISNHSPHASPVHVPLPYPATPGDHQMHHRIPQCNYCTLTTLPDRVLGTFRPYKPLPGAAPLPGRHVEALPSPWCFMFLAAGIALFAVGSELARLWLLQQPLAVPADVLWAPVAACTAASVACALAHKVLEPKMKTT